MAVEALRQPTSIDDLQPFAGSSFTPFHTSQDISIKFIQKYTLLVRNSEMLFLFSADDSDLLAIIQEVEAQLTQSHLIKESGYSRNSEEYQESETIWKKLVET